MVKADAAIISHHHHHPHLNVQKDDDLEPLLSDTPYHKRYDINGDDEEA